MQPDSKPMKSGVYQILNLINGHRYIGSAMNLERRKIDHWKSLRRSKHHNKYLQNAWNKYGESAFEFRIIGICLIEGLIRIEQHLLDDLKPEYNISPTAGSPFGVKRSEETRAKMSADRKGRIHHTPEARAKLSAALKGRPFTSEHRAKISVALKGNKHASGWKQTPEHRTKISMANQGKKNYLGKKHTPETRAKMSAAQKGKIVAPETRAKISATLKTRHASLRESQNDMKSAPTAMERGGDR